MFITAHRIYFIAFTLFDVLIAVKQTLNCNRLQIGTKKYSCVEIHYRLQHDDFSLPQSVDLRQEKARRPLAAELTSTIYFVFFLFLRQLISFTLENSSDGKNFSDVTQRLNFSRLCFAHSTESHSELRLFHAHRARPATSFFVFKAFLFCFNCSKYFWFLEIAIRAKSIARIIVLLHSAAAKRSLAAIKHWGLCCNRWRKPLIVMRRYVNVRILNHRCRIRWRNDDFIKTNFRNRRIVQLRKNQRLPSYNIMLLREKRSREKTSITESRSGCVQIRVTNDAFDDGKMRDEAFTELSIKLKLERSHNRN